MDSSLPLVLLFKYSWPCLLPQKGIFTLEIDMASPLLHIFSIFFFLSLFLPSGSSITQKPPTQETKQSRKHSSQEHRILLSPSISTTILDDVPIVNPTTPGTPVGTTMPTTPPTTTTPGSSSGGAWCVASPTASPTALQVALDYACGYGGADCSPIQPGGSCYNPNTEKDHASYAFNDYYQKNPVPTSCVFGGTAQLTNTDPSNGNCHYTSPSATRMSPPTSLTPPVTMTPPLSMAPPFTTVPGGPTVYGSAEPTGLPNSANSVHYNLVLPLATTALLWTIFGGANL